MKHSMVKKTAFFFILLSLILVSNASCDKRANAEQGNLSHKESITPKDSLTLNDILNSEYPDNPVTHKTIKFENGIYKKQLSNSGKILTIKIEKKYCSGDITEKKLPGLAAIITADSGNGIKYTYLTAFLKVDGKPEPAASLLLGSGFKVNHLTIYSQGISICWLRYEPGENRNEAPSHISCRYFFLRDGRLIDDEYEKALIKKNTFKGDSVFNNSVKTGYWTVKWNDSRAAVFFNLTGEKEGIYKAKYETFEDNDFYAGDSLEEYFNPDWYITADYTMLSVVGPYVSYLEYYEGSGGVHPIYGFLLHVFEINAKNKYKLPERENSAVDPTQILDGVKNHKAPEERLPVITDIFPEKEVFKALMKDSVIRVYLKGKKPKDLKQLLSSLEGGCDVDFTYLLESFAFKSIKNNTVVVDFGLTHGCEVNKGYFTVIEIQLNIPESKSDMFLEASKNKSTIEYLNPGFLKDAAN